MTEERPRPAREVRADDLLERVASVRQELLRRGEFLPPGWVDEAVEDLRNDRLTGWVLPSGGIGFLSRRPERAYGHVHVEPGPNAPGRSSLLLDVLLGSLDGAIRRADVGLTGLSGAEEAELVRDYPHGPTSSFLSRFALDRPIHSPEDGVAPALPEPLRHWPIRSVPLDALHSLDWDAFQGTPDATLVADTPEENRQMLGEILAGRLGLFLDAASTALADDDGRLVAAILVAQQSTGRAIILDLMVDPKGRGHGIGAYLMRWSFRALHALGYETASLWVTESNAPARRLYDRLGFSTRLTALIFRWSRPS
ncbi:MAG: GNAT family N-acetyltransferase [Thermoplasmata archaeon]|nr:GNAT family N-acetyltransferase [Thermoplasmata archaeon]